MAIPIFQQDLRFRKRGPARYWLWLALAALTGGAFLILSSEVCEATAGQPELIAKIDLACASLASEARTPALTQAFICLTALGSATTVSLFVLGAAVLLGMNRRYDQVAHLLIAAAGSALLAFLLKSHFKRPRPDNLVHLVKAQGFSYPSGHSLASAAVYFTFAVLLCRSFQKPLEKARIVLLSLVFIALIGLSRAYLGVHYISDVVAGLLVGIGWAALLVGLASLFESRKKV